MSESGVDYRELLLNPIWVKSARSRLRVKHIMSWGLVAFTLTAFISVGVYLTATENQGASPATAAKLMIVPIIFIQGIILMLLGTGAVASQLSIEREKGLLDYVRMTPLSPTAKIFGYLFGLPVREYFLFALTLPFLGFAVVVGGVSPLRMAHFYLVFFSSVLLYHMTGLVAGMASSKPRQAAMMSHGMVVLLYLILPQLSRFGMTFFEFLTVRPTFYAMVSQELASSDPRFRAVAEHQFSGLNQSGSVSFFDMHIHSTLFSVMVQMFLLVTLYQVIRRKWRDGFSHPLSKIDGLLFYLGVLVLVMGSLWPAIGDRVMLRHLIGQFGGTMPPESFLFAANVLLLVVCGATALLVINLITPTRYSQLRGLRRARKRGLGHVPLNDDGASSLRVTIAIAVLTSLAYLLLLRHADASGQYEFRLGGFWPLAAPALYFSAVVLFMQGVRERYSPRAFGVSIFMLWMVPFFVAMILMAAFQAEVSASYVSLLCPPVGIAILLADFFEHAAGRTGIHFWGGQARENLGVMTLAGLAFYGSLAVVFQSRLRRFRHRLRESEIHGSIGVVGEPADGA